ncbi:class I SAM-dependent methyltransferase [Candidatus Bathyarchaeota archaeon]|nr:class I SAM-dependent methyltransferase [Candidatus Bathyarchaeota archaeon]
MEEEYLSDQEYIDFFVKLNGLRKIIASKIPMEKRMRVLDLATGSGYFAIEIAKQHLEVLIEAIDISDDSIELARKNIWESGFRARIAIKKMDATILEYPSQSFHSAINFLGLEDIHMTKGYEGVRRVFHEVARVLKPRSYFSLTVMLPEEADTIPQKLELELFDYICGAKWLTLLQYQELLKESGLNLVKRETFKTGKKLTVNQAKEEINFACKEVPRIYKIQTKPFEEVWNKFGHEIERNGLGHYSRLVLLIARKN